MPSFCGRGILRHWVSVADNGSIVLGWFMVSHSPIPMADGKAGGCLITAIETAQSQAGERASISREQQQLRAMIDLIPGIIWSAQSDGFLDYGSQAFLDFTGLTRERISGSGWTNAIHPDDLERVASQWNDACQTGIAFEIKLRLRRHDGAFRTFLVRALPLKDATGKITRWFGLNADISDLEELEGELRATVFLLSPKRSSS